MARLDVGAIIRRLGVREEEEPHLMWLVHEAQRATSAARCHTQTRTHADTEVSRTGCQGTIVPAAKNLDKFLCAISRRVE
jgi:hypothetical protein